MLFAAASRVESHRKEQYKRDGGELGKSDQDVTQDVVHNVGCLVHCGAIQQI